MNTIRTTAIKTEKARSRTQESAFQKPPRAELACSGSTATGVRFGLSLSCIRYVIIDVLWAASVARLLDQPPKHRQRHRAFLERTVVKIGQAEGRALGLLEFVAHFQPAPPPYEVHRQLGGGELGTLELGG